MGGKDAGVKADIGVLAGRGITFANLPGDLVNFKYILKDELVCVFFAFGYIFFD